MSILSALDDPDLFGGMFDAPVMGRRGKPSWRPLFGLPMSDDAPGPVPATHEPQRSPYEAGSDIPN